MAELKSNPKITVNISLDLTEAEARALDALAGYDVEKFIEFFYKSMGRSYLEKYEHGLRSLFESARATLPGILDRIDKARKAFEQY